MSSVVAHVSLFAMMSIGKWTRVNCTCEFVLSGGAALLNSVICCNMSCLTEGLAESVVGADGAPRAFILKLGYFGLIL